MEWSTSLLLGFLPLSYRGKSRFPPFLSFIRRPVSVNHQILACCSGMSFAVYPGVYLYFFQIFPPNFSREATHSWFCLLKPWFFFFSYRTCLTGPPSCFYSEHELVKLVGFFMVPASVILSLHSGPNAATLNFFFAFPPFRPFGPTGPFLFFNEAFFLALAILSEVQRISYLGAPFHVI